MHGSMCEWCADRYGDYGAVAATDPQGPSQGAGRVSRGGSWGNDSWFCRSANRSWNDPYTTDYYIAFRVAADVPSKTP